MTGVDPARGKRGGGAASAKRLARWNMHLTERGSAVPDEEDFRSFGALSTLERLREDLAEVAPHQCGPLARVTRRVRIRLDQIIALLTLEHVGDSERPESEFFASIDPCDPVVEEICALSDGLYSAIEEADAIARTVSTRASAAFAAA